MQVNDHEIDELVSLIPRVFGRRTRRLALAPHEERYGEKNQSNARCSGSQKCATTQLAGGFLSSFKFTYLPFSFVSCEPFSFLPACRNELPFLVGKILVSLIKPLLRFDEKRSS